MFSFFWGLDGSVFVRVISGVDYHCSKIDYFPKEDYIPDASDSTMAIPCKYFIAACKVFHHFIFKFCVLRSSEFYGISRDLDISSLMW